MRKQFLLSLLTVRDIGKRNTCEYFPGMEYDPPSMGVWFDAQEDALSAGRRLKAKTNAEYCVIAYEGRQDLLREMQRVLLEDREIKWKYVMDEGANDEEK